MKKEKWTDEELIQVYDLQKRYTEKVIDFVRKGDDGDVYKFMQLIPDLNEGYLHHEQDIFRKNEFISEYGGKMFRRADTFIKICSTSGKARTHCAKSLRKSISGHLRKHIRRVWHYLPEIKR